MPPIGEKSRRFGELTYQEISTRAQQGCLPPHPFHEIWCRVADPAIPVGHADSFTTSISLYLRPESVRPEWITNPHSTEVNWNDPNLDFAQYSSTGVIGDPTYASAQLGQRLWEAVVEKVAQMLQEAASRSSDVEHG